MSLVASPPSRPARETFRVHPAFAALLDRHGLTDCESLAETESGTPLRRLKTRENWRLDLDDGRGGVATFYLKKHRVKTIGTRLRALLGLPAPTTPARVEAERARRLAALGVPTMTVAAYAERLRPDGTLVAAFLTEELSGFEQLDLFLPQRFARRDDPELRTLIERVAEVAARFHRSGFNHRDFYSCHFFVKEGASGSVPLSLGRGVRGEGSDGASVLSCTRDSSAPPSAGAERRSPSVSRHPPPFAVHLIDLQRVQQWPRWLRRRWVVKDLAQLAYSCPPALIGPTERMRFFKQYLGLRHLDIRAKRLARHVLRRETALRRKHGPYRDW